MRLFIADAAAHWRTQVRASVAGTEVEVVGESATAAEVVESAGDLRPDLLLIDLGLHGGGLMAAAQISSRYRSTRTVVTADRFSDEELFAALRAGANGIVLKSDSLERLPSILRGVMAGQLALPRSLVRPIVEEFALRTPRTRTLEALPGSQRLSRREHQVVAWVLEGRSTAEIAQLMFVEVGTVRVYLSRALRKLRVGSRAQLRDLVQRHEAAARRT